MTTYPLPTLAATVTATGITAPNYTDILNSLIASYQGVYGSDVSLDPSTQDYQWLAIIAAAINDTNQASIFVYNQFSPATSQGAGLSSVVQINGISRLIPSNSTADVTIVGQAGSTITNGQVGDNLNLNTVWNLPTTVDIPPAGEITVTATCTTSGAVTAAPGTLTKILTPSFGWQTVTNAANAAPGAPVESDSQLRQRQAQSTQLASITVAGGIVGAIENLTGVTSVTLHENDSSTVDSDGAPPNSICFSVLGGNLQDIVNIIGARKTIGCATWGGGVGATSGTYTDPTTDIEYTINFNIPTEVTISGVITIVPGENYTAAVGTEIIASVVASINALGGGASVQYTRLYPPALLVGPYSTAASVTDGQSYELTSVVIGTGGTPAAADIPIAFNQIATTTIADWTIST